MSVGPFALAPHLPPSPRGTVAEVRVSLPGNDAVYSIASCLKISPRSLAFSGLGDSHES
jgi:hypothetical protein